MQGTKTMSIWICTDHGVVEDYTHIDLDSEERVCDFCNEPVRSIDEEQI